MKKISIVIALTLIVALSSVPCWARGGRGGSSDMEAASQAVINTGALTPATIRKVEVFLEEKGYADASRQTIHSSWYAHSEGLGRLYYFKGDRVDIGLQWDGKIITRGRGGITLGWWDRL